MEKSHVTMEQHVCVVCCKTFDTGAVLLDKRLRAVFDRHTTTGMGLCPEDTKKREDGYVALIGVRNAGDRNTDKYLRQDEADRTGEVIHIKREAFDKILNAPAPEQGVAFVDAEVIEYLKRLHQEAQDG